LGISHPCTAFDKWRVIPLVDDDYRIVDLLHTYF
jgi:D-serine deaminase-like pyridoxal phosphate-dependent protein